MWTELRAEKLFVVPNTPIETELSAVDWYPDPYPKNVLEIPVEDAPEAYPINVLLVYEEEEYPESAP